MFADKTVNQFVDELASKAPVPGGGSAAALGGALAAALLSMVSNLTLGKRAYQAVAGQMQELFEQSEALRTRILLLMEQDTQVYGRVMAAYSMPKSTEAEKSAQHQIWQAALQDATTVPVDLAESCLEVLVLSLPAARLGNRWAVSDAGVAALLAEACLHAALLNAHINLQSITDEAFVLQTRERIEHIVEGAGTLRDQIVALVHQRISG